VEELEHEVGPLERIAQEVEVVHRLEDLAHQIFGASPRTIGRRRRSAARIEATRPGAAQRRSRAASFPPWSSGETT
jgi:hypothetical protein